MDDKELRDAIISIINNEDRWIPALTDLPTRWDLLEGKDKERATLLLNYRLWAKNKLWAWEGLDRLILRCHERLEPIPEPLKQWAATTRVHHRKPRQWGENADLNYRTWAAYNWLRGRDFKHGEALEKIADAFGLDLENIGYRVRKVLRERKNLICQV